MSGAVMASMSLMDESATPRTGVLTLDNGRCFITVRFNDYASLVMPGFDGASVAYARLLATALTLAADELDAKIAAQPELAEAL